MTTTTTTAARARFANSRRAAYDASGLSAELIHMAEAMTRRRASQWSAASGITLPATDLDDVSAAAVARLMSHVAGIETIAVDALRRAMRAAVRFAFADHLRERANAPRELDDATAEQWGARSETAEEAAERIAHEEARLLSLVEQLPAKTQRASLAVALSPTMVDAAALAGTSRQHVHRVLNTARAAFESPAQELARVICEALEEVRTGAPCLLVPAGIRR